MKRLNTIAVAAILALAAAAPAGVSADSARPWSGHAVGVTSFDGANPKDCLAGYTTLVDEPAIASHFGAAYLVMSHCATGDFSDNFADSDFVLYSANGDAVYGEYVGTIDQYIEELGAEGLFTLEMTITGGDGRFEGATGSAVMDGHFTFEGYDVDSWAWWASWQGTLEY
jgi:hypothetical protein